MKEDVDSLLISANQLLTMNNGLGLIEDGAVAIVDEKIVEVGCTKDLESKYNASEVIDTKGKVVTPGLIDCHTHLLFAGTREHEYEARLKGRTYLEILESGGGILNTVEHVRRAAKGDFLEHGKKYLNEFLSYGVTAVEIKSGYGLDYENEKKMLEVIAELRETSCQEIVSTFLGAHTFPAEFKNNREGYIHELTERMLPDFRTLTDTCDIFVEKGAFSYEQADRILGKAVQLGYSIRLHTNQMNQLGGIALARKYNALSVDHLDVISDDEIEMLSKTESVAVLLPGTSFFLREGSRAPARRLLDRNIPVAISTDFNPGSCPSTNLHLMMNLAVQQLGLFPEEVWQAVTVNAAKAINRDRDIGTLEVGKRASLVIWDMPNAIFPFYNFGRNFVERVVV